MSFEEGRFQKIGEYNVEAKERERIYSLFKKNKIEYLKDSSVILNNNNRIIRVIDFAVKEFEILASE